jgi:hypothetical protein
MAVSNLWWHFFVCLSDNHSLTVIYMQSFNKITTVFTTHFCDASLLKENSNTQLRMFSEENNKNVVISYSQKPAEKSGGCDWGWTSPLLPLSTATHGQICKDDVTVLPPPLLFHSWFDESSLIDGILKDDLLEQLFPTTGKALR